MNSSTRHLIRHYIEMVRHRAAAALAGPTVPLLDDIDALHLRLLAECASETQEARAASSR